MKSFYLTFISIITSFAFAVFSQSMNVHTPAGVQTYSL